MRFSESVESGIRAQQRAAIKHYEDRIKELEYRNELLLEAMADSSSLIDKVSIVCCECGERLVKGE